MLIKLIIYVITMALIWLMIFEYHMLFFHWLRYAWVRWVMKEGMWVTLRSPLKINDVIKMDRNGYTAIVLWVRIEGNDYKCYIKEL